MSPAPDFRYANPGAVYFDGSTYHMYRNSFSAWPGPSVVHHLSSADGLEWIDHGQVFSSDQVAFTEGNVFFMEVLVEGQTWVSYFYTYDGRRQPGFIGRATAPGPEGPWSPDPEPVLSPGPSGSWDGIRVMEPTVVRTADGLVMLYAGIDDAGTSSIGRASSTDGVTWVKHNDPSTTDDRLAQSDPVLVGQEDSWNQGSVGCPDVELTADGYVVLYDTLSRGKGYGMATSSDGIRWQRSEPELVLDRSGVPGSADFWQSELINVDGRHLFYLEVGPGRGPTKVYAFAFRPDTPAELAMRAEAVVVGSTVTVTVDPTGFELGFERGNPASNHPHLYVDRPPPEAGDVVPLRDPTIIHSVGSVLEVDLEPGVHDLWVVIADGNDRAKDDPRPLKLTVTVES